MADSPNRKSKNALYLLAGLIILSLITVALIAIFSNTDTIMFEVGKNGYNIFVTGLAALFIIVFRLYFWAYKKILAVLSIVFVLGVVFVPGLYNDLEEPVTSAAEKEPYIPEVEPEPEIVVQEPESEPERVPGVFEMNEPMGHYHVIVASAIDVDLLRDYGNVLADNGMTCNIIPPLSHGFFL